MKRWMLILVAVPVTALAMQWPTDFGEWWATPDQQAARAFDRGDYEGAAQRFVDPMWRGAALYRNRDFEAAAAAFGRGTSPEAHFNRGNALVFLGDYEAAIAAYETALQQRPGWLPAETNLQIARVRSERLAPPEDDAGGTGGQLGADEIVFDTSGRVAAGGEEVTMEAEQAGSDAELRAQWLRRVTTRPADFLRTKFAYQVAFSEEGGNGQ